MENLLVLLVSSLVVFHLLPESIHLVGYKALFLAALGLFLPSLLERSFKGFADQVHHASILAAVVGLAVHGITDGAALAMPSCSLCCSSSLKAAVLLHRLPVGILIWSLFQKSKGSLYTFGILGLLALGTLLGYFRLS